MDPVLIAVVFGAECVEWGTSPSVPMVGDLVRFRSLDPYGWRWGRVTERRWRTVEYEDYTQGVRVDLVCEQAVEAE